MHRFHHPPALDDIVELAEHAFSAIPEELRILVRGATIVVEEVADEETAQELGFESPWAITGLYRRAAPTQKSVLDAPLEHDTITLYRGPILLEWIETGEDLFRLIRNVLMQEIAHYFGISDADIERLERGWLLAGEWPWPSARPPC
jgi:predicted Zn-dependent protease with MMP-like domain